MKLTILLILALLVILGFYFGISNQGSKVEPYNANLETVNISDLKVNKIVHEKLSDKQISRITSFQEILKEVNTIPLEETIENFQRDVNPDKEIKIWEHIAKVYQIINEEHKELNIDKKTDIYNLLLYRSMMPKEEIFKQIKLKSLSIEEADKYLSYY